jgi:hypothetical protein
MNLQYCFLNTIFFDTELVPPPTLQLRPPACKRASPGQACLRGLHEAPAVAWRGAPTRPPQMRARARQWAAVCRRGARAQWAGAAAGKLVGAPGPPPRAASLARRAKAPGEERGRAARRGGGGGADGGGPARTVTCLLQAASAPTRPPQMRPRARQRVAL